MSLLEIKNLHFTYPNGPKVFEDLSLSIKKGEIVGILGPNGCGKSTLFDIITQHHGYLKGEILFHGESLRHSTFFTKTGCVFQNVSLDPYLTVFENLWIHGSLYEIDRIALKEKISSLAKQFQFELLLDKQVRVLSGGYARRVEIAKALINEPEFILLDEPSTGLDPKSRLDLFSWLSQIQYASDTTVLWISHMTDEVQKMDRVIMLHDGAVVCDGKPNDLIEELKYFYINAKIKDDQVIDKIEEVAQDISLQGEKIQFRIAKQQLQEVLAFLVPCVEYFMYREPNLEDVYLEKTGVYFS